MWKYKNTLLFSIDVDDKIVVSIHPSNHNRKNNLVKLLQGKHLQFAIVIPYQDIRLFNRHLSRSS